MFAEFKAKTTWQHCATALCWVLSLFLVGSAAKLQLIHKYGSSFPYLDQWDAEVIELFLPWFNHQFSAATLFQAHNEHRILFTRISELGLLLANGQWDDRLEMVFNAFVHAGAIAIIGWLMLKTLGKRAWLLLWILLALDMALPFAWENTLWGFQSQFYFLEFFSLLTIWLLGLSEPWSGRWWCGVVCSVLTLFSMASGFLAVCAVVAMVVLDILKHREKLRRQLPTLAVCAVLVIAGFLLKPQMAENPARARSAIDFFTALGKALAWPWPTKPFLAPINLLPLGLLCWAYFRFGRENLLGERLVLGIGCWVVLQSLAAAYARGRGGVVPAWRYMDFLSFLAIANVLSIWLVLTRYRERLKYAPIWYATAGLWIVGCACGLAYLSERAWADYIPDFVVEKQKQLESTRAFLTTGDERVLMSRPSAELILTDARKVAALLRQPLVRQILPACARDTFKLVPIENGRETFIRNGVPFQNPDSPGYVCWGSYSPQTSRRTRGFDSLPVGKSSLPYLEIAIAGDLGRTGSHLGLIDASNGQIIELHADQPAKEQWSYLHVKAPAGEFKVIAKDDGNAGWFGFMEPREMGRLSYWALRTATAWKLFLCSGLVLFIAACGFGITRPASGEKLRSSKSIVQEIGS